MHAIHKILVNHCDTDVVKPGDNIECDIDLCEVNDLYLQVITSFQEMGGDKVFDPNKVVFVMDHYAPAPTIKSAMNQREMRQFVWDQGIPHLFDINAGICHQVMPEAGLVYPGMILIATDSHTTTHGAFGAFGTGMGATDLSVALLTGKLWLRVPEVVKIELIGSLTNGTMAKDVILHILGQLKADAMIFKAVEFTGEAVDAMSISERMVLCNMAVELGAQTAYIQPDEKVFAYLRSKGVDVDAMDIPQTDETFTYDETHVFDITALPPQVAVPNTPDNVLPLEAIVGRNVDQVFIGSCTGGRLEDIEVAYKILRGKKIAERTRLIIIPASQEVNLQAMDKGYVQALVRAGATFTSPGCGPCLGTHQGIVAPGEVCVTATNRNFPGRMGSSTAEIYLVSPYTAALCALEGKIVSHG